MTSGSLASVVMAKEMGAPEAAAAQATSWMGTPLVRVSLDERSPCGRRSALPASRRTRRPVKLMTHALGGAQRGMGPAAAAAAAAGVRGTAVSVHLDRCHVLDRRSPGPPPPLAGRPI